jgi:hypothetical protein
LDTVELERLKELENTNSERISLEDIKAYQRYCWGKSENINCGDKITGTAEVQLLWCLCGAYREKDGAGRDAIPLKLVVDFLKENSLLEQFRMNQRDPATLGTLIYAIVSRGFCCFH